jgi:hypothetical protein
MTLWCSSEKVRMQIFNLDKTRAYDEKTASASVLVVEEEGESSL